MRNWNYGREYSLFGDPSILIGPVTLMVALGAFTVLVAVWATHTQQPATTGQPVDQRPAVQVLDRRYARGELTEEDYLRRRDILGRH